MIRRLATALLVAAAIPAGAGLAQPIGPPIPPQQQFQAQPVPRTQLPPVYVPPVGDSAIVYGVPPLAVPPQGSSRGRAAECQHQATVERVPRRQRGAYIHNCMMY